MVTVIDGLVSTVIPVFNRPGMLIEAVESVIAQSYRPIEIIVVDDGSTDATPESVARLCERFSDTLRTIRIDNAGPGSAREAGRKLVKGEFIQYLDSDDLLYPGKFALQVAALLARPEADIAYGRTVYRTGETLTEECAGKRSSEKMESLFPALLASRWWSTATPLYRARVSAPWSSLRQEEDWEYESRVAIAWPELVFVDQVVAEIRHHAEHRASGEDADWRDRLADRARARLLIYKHARDAAIPHSAVEMQHFGRATFLLGRQCAAAGLPDEAALLVHLAGRIGQGTKRWQPALFRAGAAVLGWRRAGRLASRLDQWRG